MQVLLNQQRAEAIRGLEAERKKHLEARMKVRKRIGNPEEPPEEEDDKFKPYNVLPAMGRSPDRIYRIDAFGQNMAWMEYRNKRNDVKEVRAPLPLLRGPPMTAR